jgi:hypothetical protein
MQLLWLAHEYISLVHIDVANIFGSDVDRLHERSRVHIMQVSAINARANERRVCEPVCAGEGWER